jgi:hypothetical protein
MNLLHGRDRQHGECKWDVSRLSRPRGEFFAIISPAYPSEANWRDYRRHRGFLAKNCSGKVSLGYINQRALSKPYFVEIFAIRAQGNLLKSCAVDEVKDWPWKLSLRDASQILNSGCSVQNTHKNP